jgi:hypothetical protein
MLVRRGASTLLSDLVGSIPTYVHCKLQLIVVYYHFERSLPLSNMLQQSESDRSWCTFNKWMPFTGVEEVTETSYKMSLCCSELSCLLAAQWGENAARLRKCWHLTWAAPHDRKSSRPTRISCVSNKLKDKYCSVRNWGSHGVWLNKQMRWLECLSRAKRGESSTSTMRRRKSGGIQTSCILDGFRRSIVRRVIPLLVS